MTKTDNSNRYGQRSSEELVIKAFRLMIRDGEAVRTHVSIPLAYGGTLDKVIYKVKPR